MSEPKFSKRVIVTHQRGFTINARLDSLSKSRASTRNVPRTQAYRSRGNHRINSQVAFDISGRSASNETSTRNDAWNISFDDRAGDGAKPAKPGASCGQDSVASSRQGDWREQREVLDRGRHRLDGLPRSAVRPGRPAAHRPENLHRDR